MIVLLNTYLLNSILRILMIELSVIWVTVSSA